MFKKLGKWFLSIMQEDSGKGSIKRWLALFAFTLLAFINIYTALHDLTPNTMSFCQSITDALLIFICTLLGMTFLPVKRNDPTINSDNK